MGGRLPGASPLARIGVACVAGRVWHQEVVPPFLLARADDAQIATVAALVSLLCLWLAMRAGRRRRLLDDTPVSKALSVFIGEVELDGVCVLERPFIGELSGKPCVAYRWTVSEQWVRWETETYTDDKGRTRTRRVRRTGWDVVAGGRESSGFYLRDETGFVWVDPDGAVFDDVETFSRYVDRSDPLYYTKSPDETVEGSTGERHFQEYGVVVGTRLFVRGRASERTDIPAAKIAKHPDQEMFIITHRRESELSDGSATAFVIWSVLGAVPAALASFGLMGARAVVGDVPVAAFVGVGVYGLLFLLGWVWMVFNSLVGVRNRVARARSLVEVQLKRRADLIPRLAACLAGYRAHERAVQETVAALRAQAAGGGLSAVGPSLLALREAYPDILAVESFNALSSGVVETEQRIALARNYLNDCVMFHNIRLERVPDRYVARLAGMRAEEPFRAEGFERLPSAVTFS